MADAELLWAGITAARAGDPKRAAALLTQKTHKRKKRIDGEDQIEKPNMCSFSVDTC